MIINNIVDNTNYFCPYSSSLVVQKVRAGKPNHVYKVLPLHPLWRRLQGGIKSFFDSPDNQELLALSFAVAQLSNLQFLGGKVICLLAYH